MKRLGISMLHGSLGLSLLASCHSAYAQAPGPASSSEVRVQSAGPPPEAPSCQPGIRQEYTPYSDCDGLVQDARQDRSKTGFHATNGNGVLYTSEAFVFMSAHADVKPEDRENFAHLVQDVQVERGLINRSPPRGHQPGAGKEGWDDYVGLVAASHALGGDARGVARDVLEYGIRTGFLFNNINPGTNIGADGKADPSFVFARYPEFPAHLFFAAGMVPPPGLRLLWAGAITAGSTELGPLILQWLMVNSTPRNLGAVAPECAIAKRRWLERFARRYPGGIKDALRDYFTDKTHPLIAAAVDLPEGDDAVGLQGILVEAATVIEAMVEAVLEEVSTIQKLADAKLKSLASRANPAVGDVLKVIDAGIDVAGAAIDVALLIEHDAFAELQSLTDPDARRQIVEDARHEIEKLTVDVAKKVDGATSEAAKAVRVEGSRIVSWIKEKAELLRHPPRPPGIHIAPPHPHLRCFPPWHICHDACIGPTKHCH